ncbi:MAG: oleate hydratase, partial [Olsenella sp.]
MYYSSGNYEAFARPRKPEGIDDKSAYIVGTGLAGLSAACFLVRDAQMPGSHIHILEARDVAGGACDGASTPIGFTMRGGREMDNHFEVMWDLYRSIPSIETPGISVLDEYYWLNKDDPNYSLCRATENRGQDAHTDKKFGLSDKASQEIAKLFLSTDESLFGKAINEIWDDEVFNSNFWLYWRTMFAFENWHSALEVKRYLQRYVHHIGGLPDFTALRFTKYNQYDSMILPMVRYLEAAGATIQYNSKVVNVEFDIVPASANTPSRKVARAIVVERADETGATHEERINLTENDQVYITDGGCV